MGAHVIWKHISNIESIVKTLTQSFTRYVTIPDNVNNDHINLYSTW